MKYSVLYTSQPVIITLFYAAVFIVALIYVNRIKKGAAFLNKKAAVIISVLISLAVLIYILLVPRMGEIGRIPAIEYWIQRLENGFFPYSSSIAPSAFPILFLLAYPFYLIGNTGLLVFTGLALLMFFIISDDDSPKFIFIKILLVLFSVVIAYEIVTRSELLFNMMLVVLIVSLSEKKMNYSAINFNFILIAVLTGLVLSTRTVTAFLFIIYFLYKFRYNLKNLLLFGAAALVIFIVTLLPFYLWDPELFLLNGPFAVQSYISNLPVLLIIIIFMSAVYAGWIISDIQEFYFAGGMVLFFAVLISFFIKVLNTDFSSALINDGYDISYFIFCIPLLILSIKDYATDPYLGKITPVIKRQDF